jgi:hypothetical protein
MWPEGQVWKPGPADPATAAALKEHRIPAQGIALGTASERNRCVLKEHRVGMAGGDKAIALTIKRVIHTLI